MYPRAFCSRLKKSHLAITDTKSSYWSPRDWHKINDITSAAGPASIFNIPEAAGYEQGGRNLRRGREVNLSSRQVCVLTDGLIDCILWPRTSMIAVHLRFIYSTTFTGRSTTVVRSSLPEKKRKRKTSSLCKTSFLLLITFQLLRHWWKHRHDRL